MSTSLPLSLSLSLSLSLFPLIQKGVSQQRFWSKKAALNLFLFSLLSWVASTIIVLLFDSSYIFNIKCLVSLLIWNSNEKYHMCRHHHHWSNFPWISMWLLLWWTSPINFLTPTTITLIITNKILPLLSLNNSKSPGFKMKNQKVVAF